MRGIRRWRIAAFAAAGVAGTLGGALAVASPGGAVRRAVSAEHPRSPIKHVVVIFQENVSFDHYFGTYPHAANTSGQPFFGRRHVRVDNLADTPGAGGHRTLLTNNPNRDASNTQVNPRRLDPSNINDILTCDQDHDYNDEQKAFDGGLMDKFITTVGTGTGTSGTGQPCHAGDVMNYYDGNTVTALWNYAQRFALSDSSYDTTFGPSSPGAVNLISGDTGNVGLTINGAATDGQRRSWWPLADLRRPAVLRRLLDARRGQPDRPQHRRRPQPGGPQLGLVPGRVPSHDLLRHRDGVGTSADEHLRPGRVQGQVRGQAGIRSGALQRRSPGRSRAWRDGRHGSRPNQLRQQGRLHPPPRAVPVLHLNRQPASPAAGVTCRDRDRYADDDGRQAPVRYRQPSVRHERFRCARGGDQPWLPLAGSPAGGEFPEGPRVPGRTRGLLGSV